MALVIFVHIEKLVTFHRDAIEPEFYDHPNSVDGQKPQVKIKAILVT